MRIKNLGSKQKRLRMDFQSGFTLMELLVVVLIVGVLAAVALPRYENAVLKSRAAELLANLRVIRQAADAYYLANGKYPLDFTEIDIAFPGMELGVAEGLPNSSISLPNGSRYDLDVDGYIGGYLPKYGITLNSWYNQPAGIWRGRFVCRATTERTEMLCKSLGGTFNGENSLGRMYGID